MSKAKYPPNLKTTQSLTETLQDFSATLDSWTKARENSFQAQYKLLQSCKDDEELHALKAKGLLNFESTVF
jgi:hypothetical protein